MSGSEGPLKDVKVISFSQYIAGPFCAQNLGDLGAEVIKIEKPGQGDYCRNYPPLKDSMSCFFASFNRNKKSISLNLKKKRGKEIGRELVKEADVFIENYSPEKVSEFDLNYDSVKEINEDIIYCSIKGYGEGPYAGRKAYDLNIQGESGLASITGEKDGHPLRIPISATDVFGSSEATTAIVSSLYGRKMTGGEASSKFR